MTDDAHDDVAVLVCSLDEYADVWPDFFSLWFRFWPDLPFAMHLVTNEYIYDDPRVRTLPVGVGIGWSHRMRRALEVLPQTYILFSTEDFFLYDKVDTSHLIRLYEDMRLEQAAYLRLMAHDIPYTPHPRLQQLGCVEKGTPYRGAGQLTFWNRRVLLATLQGDESAAEWERQTTARTEEMEAPFLTVREGVAPIKYHNMIRAGKWNRDAVRDYAARGIGLRLSTRPVQNNFDIWWHTPSASRRALSSCKHIALRAIGSR